MRRLLAGLDVRDVVAVIGLGLIATGLALVYVPAALVVLGVLLFGLAVLPSLGAMRRR